jgi:SulP family sulfate permease
LLELKTTLAQQEKEFLLALTGGAAATERLEHFGVLSSIGEANILPDIDRAIERAENYLLRVQAQLYREEIPLVEVGLFAKLNPTDLAAIEPYLRHASYRQDEVIFREGDPGSEVFIVTKGTASAFLHSSPFNIRLGTFAPGTAFGELAILDAGPRSATVIADEDLACFVLTAANFEALTEKHPDVAGRILAAIGRELSGRLRTANRTIHQLET